jgi:hypothetical protein
LPVCGSAERRGAGRAAAQALATLTSSIFEPATLASGLATVRIDLPDLGGHQRLESLGVNAFALLEFDGE